MTVPPPGRDLRRLAGRLAGRVAERRGADQPDLAHRPPDAPVLTVVVPVHNVESMLRECLDSLLGQSLTDLEVIAVDDGSTDQSLAILQDAAERDPRLRVLTQANAGQGAARNRAVAEARGEFLTFCDSDDVVPRRAYAHMVAVLRRTGSDFCVGAVRRFTHAQKFPKSWRGVHDHDVLATTIDDFPAAMQDIIACNRMFRTSFWHEQVPPFRSDLAYEDHVPMLAAYVRARAFDSLARVTYLWRSREDNSSTGQRKAELENLLDRVAVEEEAHDLLLREASTIVYDAWVGRTIAVDYQPYIRYALGAGPMYRNVLGAAFRTMLDRSSDAALDHVPFRSKARAWWCAEGRWDLLVATDRHLETDGKLPPTAPDGPRLRVIPEPTAAHLVELPERLLALSTHESDLRAGLRRAEWLPNDDLRLTGFAFIRGLDGAQHLPELHLTLLEEGSGQALALPAVPMEDPRINTVGSAYTDQRRCGFDAVVPAAELASASRALPATWTVRASLTLGEIVREGYVDGALDGAPTARLDARTVRVDEEDLSIRPSLGETGLRIEVRAGAADPPTEPRAAVTEVRVDDGVHVVVALPGGEGATAAVTLTAPDLEVDAVGVERGPHELHVTVPTTSDRWGTGNPGALPPGRYRLAVTLDRNGGDDGDDRDTVVAEPGPGLGPQLPTTHLGPDLRLDLWTGGDGALVLAALPAVPLDDATPLGQRRLRTAYRQASPEVDPDLVLLVCHDGHLVDGDPLAIDRELARTRPQLRRVWGVLSHATPPPHGSHAVVIGSEAWYDALATAGHVVVDGDLPDVFVKRPGQRVVQTFRGRPFKAIGHAWWRHVRRASEEVADALEHGARAWDVALAPDPDAAAAYEAQLDLAGRVAVVGTPQYDDLVVGDRAAARARVLRGLGLDEAATVVLHAPTYRDTFSPRVRSAGLRGGLDVVRVARDLGPEAVVLLRAHPEDRRAAAELTRGTSVVDVSDYPSVIDLVHASDVAVLDYSTLRFGWALTGRPAICHVPDLAQTQAVRPFLADYAPTAPGPLTTTTEEVIALLRDVPALARLGSADLERVRTRYTAGEDGHAAARAVAVLFPG